MTVSWRVVEDGAQAVGAVFGEGGERLLVLLVGQVEKVKQVAGAQFAVI